MERLRDCPTATDRRATIAAFRRALDREAHALSQRPDLLWQQLFNRLQWVSGNLERQLRFDEERRQRTGTMPWLRSRVPPRESESLIATYAGHHEMVCCCDISSDGSFVVSGDLSGIHAWDLATTRLRVEMEESGSGKRIYFCCAISPDQEIVAAGDGSGMITLWDALSGLRIRAIRAHADRVNACRFSPDGTSLVSCSHDGTVKVWETSGWTLTFTFEGHEHWVLGCALSPDGTSVMSAGWDKSLRLWDLQTGEQLALLETDRSFLSCAFSGDGRLGVAGSFGRLQVWDFGKSESSRILRTSLGSPQEHLDDIHACLMSPDGIWIAAARGDATVSLWCAIQESEPRRLEGHGDSVLCCAVTLDGSRLVTGSADGTLKVWDAAGESVALLQPKRSRLRSVGRFLAEAAREEVEREVGIANGPQHHSGGVNDCVFGPDGSWIVTGSDDGDVVLWSADDARWIRTMGYRPGGIPVVGGHQDLVGGLAVSGDGAIIVSAGDDAFLVWDRVSGDVRCSLGPSAGPGGGPATGRSCAASPDGSLVATAVSLEDHLSVWDTVEGREVALLRSGEVEVTDCVWSRDGRILVSAHLDGSLTTWETAEWQRIGRIEVERRCPARTCAASAEANVLLSGDSAGALRFFDGRTGRRRFKLQAHAGGVHDCAMSPDGQVAASVGADRFLRIWDVTQESERVAVPLPSDALCVDLSPRETLVAVGDTAGDLYLFDLIGFRYEAQSPCPAGRRLWLALDVPASREKRRRWFERMKISHLTLPSSGRPALWFCLASLAAKGLAGVGGLMIGLAGLGGLAWLAGEVDSGIVLRLALSGLITFTISLAIFMTIIFPGKE